MEHLTDMTMTAEEIEKDDMESMCRFEHYMQEYDNWSSRERYIYAMRMTRWAKRVRDKLDHIVEYLKWQECPDRLNEAEEAQTRQEDKWSPIVCFWIREYRANEEK